MHSPAFLRVRFSDPEELTEGIRGAELEPCQLSDGPRPSELARMVLDGAALDLARLGPAMHFRGRMPARHHTLVYVVDCPTPGHSYNFSVRHGRGYLGLFAPGDPLDAMTPPGYANGSLTIPEAEFARLAAVECPEAADRWSRGGAALLPELPEQRVLDAVIGEAARLSRDPAQPLASHRMRAHLGRSLIAAYLRALGSGWRRGRLVPEVRVAQAHRRMREAHEFLAANLPRPVYLADLCAALGLQRRAVEKLFHDFLGVTPTTYLRHRRLHAARRALRSAPLTPGTVKRVALDWGFWHLGHFAADYRRLFGEPPHRTNRAG